MFRSLTKAAPAAQIERRSLETLVAEAEALGAIHVYTSRDRQPPCCYHVEIKFRTIKGTQLEAASEFHMSLHEAFEQALARAKTVAGQFR